MSELDLIDELEDRIKYNRLFQYEPYKWQKEYHNDLHSERMLICANQVGKSFSAAHEVAIHATGLYPDWWEGKRFNRPKLIWAASQTNEDCRDIAQVELLGGLTNRECNGTGAIPKHCLTRPKIRQAGIGDVVDYVDVRWHENGKPTDHFVRLQFKSYEQGWKKFQGRKVDVIWLDEEPDQFKIYSECLMRTINTGGIVMVTFTPLSGWTELVERFYSGEHDNYVLNVGWDDAPHISKERREEMLSKFPAHERDARSKGIPMLGEGRIYEVPEENFVIDLFEIPSYWPQIIGIDFGVADPKATVKLAVDRENDIIYLVSSSKFVSKDVLPHIECIRRMGGSLDTDKIPVSWPHDGLNRTGEKGEQLIKSYQNHRLTLLNRTARFENDVGGTQSVEKGIDEINQRLESGRFKVFSSNQDWLKEYRNYHRKDGKIPRQNDHLMDAARYAVMMLRFARTKIMRTQNTGMARPALSSR